MLIQNYYFLFRHLLVTKLPLIDTDYVNNDVMRVCRCLDTWASSHQPPQCRPCSQVTSYGTLYNLIWLYHCSGVIMSAMASQITSISIVFLTICSGADQRKHQSSTSLALIVTCWHIAPSHYHQMQNYLKCMSSFDPSVRFNFKFFIGTTW